MIGVDLERLDWELDDWLAHLDKCDWYAILIAGDFHTMEVLVNQILNAVTNRTTNKDWGVFNAPGILRLTGADDYIVYQMIVGG